MIDFQLYFSCMAQNKQKYWMFAVFTLNIIEAGQKKQNMVMKTYKELFGICIKSKK